MYAAGAAAALLHEKLNTDFYENQRMDNTRQEESEEDRILREHPCTQTEGDPLTEEFAQAMADEV